MKHLDKTIVVLLIAALLGGCREEEEIIEEPTPEVLNGALVGRAILPAATFAEGPTSGTNIGAGPINGQDVPFTDKQPVQGISAIIANDDGTFWAMPDNGFGSMENSADFHLRVYKMKPNFKTAAGGDGSVEVLEFIELSDPNGLVPFAIVNHFTEDRVLTGADFDIESMQRAPDGTLWFGDEFGPFLLHTDASGVMLDAPFQLPDFASEGQYVRSPQNPYNEEASAVRIMNAVRTHARQNGNTRTPVFSPYHVMLAYPGSDPSAHYARGENPQTGLTPAASDVFSIGSIRDAGYPIVTWTVNTKERMLELMALGVDGIISDRPDLLLEAVSEFDADGDGTPGDYLTAQGLIDGSKFDAQGHRGGRNLRPENTLPAMEAALDNLMVTLETDTGVTSDGVPVLNHDPYINAAKCVMRDGTAYDEADQWLIKDHTAQEIQETFICDQIIRGEPQTNDRELSPVAVAFAADNGLNDPYVMPTLAQLFAFVDAYIDYYETGAGVDHPAASLRVANAKIVRFNIETKLNPRSDTDKLGNVYKERTIAPEPFTQAVTGVITSRGLEDRADIQSFDFRTLLLVQENEPTIRTVYLFGDFPIYDEAATDDGTNLQDEDGANTPWLAGLYWPYRSTVMANPFKAQRSGGFEGMALSADGTKLLPVLEMPLTGAQHTLIHEFDLDSKTFTGAYYRYPMAGADRRVSDFVMVDGKTGLVIERDESQGSLSGVKSLYRVTVRQSGQYVEKVQVANLLNLEDKDGIAEAVEGDVGVGGAAFAMPFVTIESVAVLSDSQVCVVNDNNYPFSVGRHVGTEQPDDTEFVLIDLSKPLTGN